jgi:FMN phosphatase YigB (HAD superfamily)
MGNVLIEWNPERLIARLGITGADAALLLREVFGDQEWVGLDRGRLTEEQAIAAFCARLPERLHECVPPLVFWWKDPLWPVPGMKALVEELKAAGYGIYLLSNAGESFARYEAQLPARARFDGMVVSCYERVVKPDARIYRILLER